MLKVSVRHSERAQRRWLASVHDDWKLQVWGWHDSKNWRLTHSHVWQLMMPIIGYLSQNIYMWLLHVAAWASLQYGDWVPKVSIPKSTTWMPISSHDLASEVHGFPFTIVTNPPKLKERNIDSQLLIVGVSKLHCKESMWDGRYCGSQL